MENEKDKKIDKLNSFNLNDDLNEIINTKIEEEESDKIKNALAHNLNSDELNEINAKIDAEIDAQINAQLSKESQAKTDNKKSNKFSKFNKPEKKKKAKASNGNDDEKDEKEKKRKRNNIIIIALIIILVVIGSIFLGIYIYDHANANKDAQEMSEIIETTNAPVEPEVENVVQNPYDFESLKAKNEDIYSWIVVPNTKVDYPVVQSPNEDDFYLKRSGITKEWQASGAIFTQKVNKLDYSDPLTVIYGHNGYKDSMFTTLHQFEKKDFFDQNEFFYVYTEDAKLTYQIVSAFKFDDRHLMYAYNMQDLNSRQAFMNMIQNPDSSNKNVRDIGRTLTNDDKICVLSTCITNQKSNRYLVCGVLVNNEKTN